MKLFKIIGVIILTSILQACPGGDHEETLVGNLIVKNTSNNDVLIYATHSDRSIDLSEDILSSKSLSIINPKSNYRISVIREFFKNNYHMRILIFKQSTVDKYSWKEIQEKNLYDKKYAFTLKDLEAINYTIVYDGK